MSFSITQPQNCIAVAWRVEGRVNLGTVLKVRSPCTRLYVAVVFAMHIHLLTVCVFDLGISHSVVSYVTTRPLSPDMYGLLSQWTLGWAAKPHSTESVMVLPSVHQLND